MLNLIKRNVGKTELLELEKLYKQIIEDKTQLAVDYFSIALNKLGWGLGSLGESAPTGPAGFTLWAPYKHLTTRAAYLRILDYTVGDIETAKERLVEVEQALKEKING